MEEKAEAERLRTETGLDDDAFAVYWLLRNELPAEALAVAREVESIYRRFPNAQSNKDEFRQLKAEMYKALRRVVTNQRMVELTEEILNLRKP